MPEYDGLPWIPADLWPAWRLRIRAEHAAGNLTRARRDALTALLGLLCTGDAEPTDAEAAAVARCSTRTVRRARADARELGLLSWERTRALVAGAWRQGRNRYSIAMPDRPVCPRPQVARMAAQVSKIRKKETLEAPSAAPSMPAHVAQAALDAIRRRRVAALGVSG